MKTPKSLIPCALAMLLASGTLSAEVPGQIHYQGLLADENGNPVNGNRTIEVRLFDALTGGKELYHETIGPVKVVNGIYSFAFGGNGTGIAAALTGANDYLSVSVNGTEQIPRTKILAVPYALKAKESADTQLLATQVGGLQTQASGLSANLTAVQAQTAAQGSNLLEMGNMTSNLTQKINELQSGASEVEKQLQDLAPRNGEIDAFINTLKTTLHELGISSKEAIVPSMVAIPEGLVFKTPMPDGVSPFEIGKYEVTWSEWKKVREFALANGYDLDSIGAGLNDDHPVQFVYVNDVLKWCNAKSEMEGLRPFYKLAGEVYKKENFLADGATPKQIQNPDPFAFLATPPSVDQIWCDWDANGYRLPTQAEWNWAAQGGREWVNPLNNSGNLEKPGISYLYSGGNDINAVAWYEGNSLGGSKSVGTKLPNQLGIHDMSGNVWEWCMAVAGSRIRGGGWKDAWWGWGPEFVSSSTVVEPNELKSPLTRGGLAEVGFRLARNNPENFVLVLPGDFPSQSEFVGTKLDPFLLCKYEVTFSEWSEVRDWGVANGYTDLADVGQGSASNHPVRNVNWFDVLKWCNAKSEKNGLEAVYLSNGGIYRSGEAVPQVNSSASGYRLPTELEWEWAAKGGIFSKGYIYSGSNDLNLVAWHYGNSMGAELDLYEGRGTAAVGLKQSNELGIYDMSGNVWEWCFNKDNNGPVNRGGGWAEGNAALFAIENRKTTDYQGDRGSHFGFRIARKAGL